MEAYPTSERSLLLFVAYLFTENLAPSTIKTYLAAVRYEQIGRGLGDPCMAQMPQLEYAIKGAKRLSKCKKRNRLPITPRILAQLKNYWSSKKEHGNRDCMMLWGACCLCFFGFLRSGEVVAPTESSYDPDTTLCYNDVRIDNRSKPSFMQVVIKASKTDPFRQGVSVYIGTTNSQLCPVAAVIGFMVERGNSSGPLFTWSNGHYLTRDRFVLEVRKALSAVGIKAEDYAGHSFRIGAATTAAEKGVQDSLIKTLGRWQSSAYTLYIKTPQQVLCNVARTLVQD